MAKVVILSGAGISAESGVQTFRDSGGLWEGHDISKVAKKGVLETNRAEAIEFYDKRRLDIKDKQPNGAHKVVVELKKKYPNDIAVITQNVDDLFEKAGLDHDDVFHLHGYLQELQCEKCGEVYNIKYQKQEDAFNGKCPTCHNKKVRPNIVMFGEIAPNYKKLRKELQDCKLLVVIGTSGNVVDVNSMAQNIQNTILNNLERSDAIDDSLFTKVFYKKATEATDEIKNEVEYCLKDTKQKYNYKCSKCESEYVFYKDIDQFECTICKSIVEK